MHALEVDNLRKEFRRRDGRVRLRRRRRLVEALRGLSFDVERGECVAILGQNGSGKSTLVRLLSTLLLPDGGSARVFGRDSVRDTRAVRRLVNRVSVEASFFKKMSAVENLSYAARFYGLRASETKGQIPEILGRVGFPADRRGDPMEHLSRGMQQKVALARALLTAPILLVGAVIWAFLRIIFEILTETVAWERLEGKIEYTFMAPLSPPVDLFG